MKKIFYISLFLLFLGNIKAQNDNTFQSFFKDVNFNDTLVVQSSEFKSLMLDYITLAQKKELDPKQRDYAAMYAIEEVMRASSVNFYSYKDNYLFLLDGFMRLEMDRLVEFMTDFPGIYEAHFTDAQMVELAMISERYSRVGIGKQAPIIDTLDVDGKPFNINTLSAKYVVVAFFSYDCQHCQEFMEEIGPFLKENPDFDLVGMAVIGSKREVRRMRRKNDLADRHFFWGEGEWDGVYTRAYAVNSLPAIFVLDEARRIVAKPLNVNDLNEFVESVK